MVATAVTWAYRRLGRLYPRVFMALELQTAYPIILGTYALFSFYYEGDTGTFFLLFGITCALAALSIVIACAKTFPMLRPLETWIAGERSERATAEALGRGHLLPVADDPQRGAPARDHGRGPERHPLRAAARASWLAAPFIAAGSLVALGYSSMLHYFALEIGLRPVLVDINQQLTPRTDIGLSALAAALAPSADPAADQPDHGPDRRGSHLGGRRRSADLGLDVAIAVVLRPRSRSS